MVRAMELTMNTNGTERHFFRCADCLGIFGAELPRVTSAAPGPWALKKAIDAAIAPLLLARCPYECGAVGELEHLGALDARGQITKVEGGETPCDSSCTHARGAKCECPCGGANHGVGVLADFLVLSDGGTPEARFRAAPKSKAQSIARAAEWRAALVETSNALDTVRAELDELDGRKSRRVYLDGPAYDRWRTLRALFRGAREAETLRTHAGRLKALERVREGVKPKAVAS